VHRTAIAAALAAILLAAGPAAAQQRTLTVGVQTPPSALDPHYHNTTNNNMALRHIFEALFEVGPDAKLQPGLAESLRNIDATTWEVKLRPGVRFHDGTPLEAEDIAFTFARVPTVPNSPALFTPQVRTISAIEIKDPQTVVIRTREPNPLLHFDLSGPAILSRKVHGPSPSTSDFTNGKLAIGTGPYRLVEYKHNERLELARHENHWAPPQPWDRVVFRYIPQPGSRTAAGGRKRRASMTPKVATLTPMPSASTSATSSEKPGARPSWRAAPRRSAHTVRSPGGRAARPTPPTRP